MLENTIISGTKAEIWNQIRQDLCNQSDVLAYNKTVLYNGSKIVLDIDIDLGGGFESGFSSTTIVALLTRQPTFRFAIHKQHFTDSIGKFFGMQDVVIGYKDFDEKFVIKTDNRYAIRHLFADDALRQRLLALSDITLCVHHHITGGDEKYYLDLSIDMGITDPAMLEQYFDVFYEVLKLIESPTAIPAEKTDDADTA